jgi:hypothetical protein
VCTEVPTINGARKLYCQLPGSVISMQQQMHRTLRSSSRPAAQATQRTSSPPATVPIRRSNGSRVLTICKPLSPTRWRGSDGVAISSITGFFGIDTGVTFTRAQITSARWHRKGLILSALPREHRSPSVYRCSDCVDLYSRLANCHAAELREGLQQQNPRSGPHSA